MSRLSGFVIVSTIFLAIAGEAVADECRFEEPREAVLDASGAEILRISAAAGSLRVEGRPGVSEVRVEGTACASSRELVEEIRLESVRRGDKLEIVAKIPERSGWSWSSWTARLDLVIEVPTGLELTVEDGSGPATFARIGTLRLDDGSGEIEIREASGDVRLDDGSGEIDIEGVEGDLWLTDGSGSMRILGVAGTVTIDTDGSGEITIRDVDRDVLIRNDGSGSITIEEIDGNVTIEEDGSGSIFAKQVNGDFTVSNDGSGGIRFDDIGGRVRVP